MITKPDTEYVNLIPNPDTPCISTCMWVISEVNVSKYRIYNYNTWRVWVRVPKTGGFHFLTETMRFPVNDRFIHTPRIIPLEQRQFPPLKDGQLSQLIIYIWPSYGRIKGASHSNENKDLGWLMLDESHRNKRIKKKTKEQKQIKRPQVSQEQKKHSKEGQLNSKTILPLQAPAACLARWTRIVPRVVGQDAHCTNITTAIVPPWDAQQRSELVNSNTGWQATADNCRDWNRGSPKVNHLKMVGYNYHLNHL